ncbi:MAG: helix-turn-helix domain-containing protein [Acidimicrobiia bacterium]|nr:helix-turn-helix domain-containing protein [Acidimicrobiia bacterium]
MKPQNAETIHSSDARIPLRSSTNCRRCAGVVAPPWFRGYADPLVGRVLRLMQNGPAGPWTVASLAAAAVASRAWLARRFHELVGEPPMSFLASWRMALAADVVLEPGATVTALAREFGYGSPFTFSTAFKRHHGLLASSVALSSCASRARFVLVVRAGWRMSRSAPAGDEWAIQPSCVDLLDLDGTDDVADSGARMLLSAGAARGRRCRRAVGWGTLSEPHTVSNSLNTCPEASDGQDSQRRAPGRF